MGKKYEVQNDKQRVQSVLDMLKKQAPLTLEQEKFCNNACVERFLKAKGDSVKKATKHLRNCLSWRDSLGIDHLMADEFSAELAEGMAYVAGHDDGLRPEEKKNKIFGSARRKRGIGSTIFRIKQDYQKLHSQKLFARLLVFTLEVAVQTMAKNIEQFVVLIDASLFRSASAFMNMLLATLKIIADYYPRRLHRAFVIDPPSLFSYLWKGVRPFVELSPLTVMVSSLDFEEPIRFDDLKSLSFGPSSAKRGACSSSRFSFTVSHHFDSLKPWYLSLKGTPGSKLGETNPSHTSLGPRISPFNARSFSFASPGPRATGGNIKVIGKAFFPSTPMPQKNQKIDPSMIRNPTTPTPSSLQSPASFFRRDYQLSRVEKTHELFVPFLKFHQWPYDEMIYRSKMRPPLGGLISFVSPQFKRRDMSISQRF